MDGDAPPRRLAVPAAKGAAAPLRRVAHPAAVEAAPLGAGIMIMVNDIDAPKQNAANRLTLVSRNGQSFVSAIELPEFDMVLRFRVPAETNLAQISAIPAAGTSLGR